MSKENYTEVAEAIFYRLSKNTSFNEIEYIRILLQTAYNDGFDTGFSAGSQEGYTEGYVEGFTACLDEEGIPDV